MKVSSSDILRREGGREGGREIQGDRERGREEGRKGGREGGGSREGGGKREGQQGEKGRERGRKPVKGGDKRSPHLPRRKVPGISPSYNVLVGTHNAITYPSLPGELSV